MGEDEFSTIDRRSLAEHAVDQIERLIIDGRLVSGQKLPSERDLGVKLGVSRPTLREAIRALMVMGILESRQGDGTYVLDSETDFRLRPAKVLLASEGGLGWLVEVRALLEGGADIWAIVGEEHLVSRWQREDRDRASRFDIATHYHRAQIEDFLDAICEARLPLVPGEEGRKSVEIAAAIYKSQAKRAPVRFPVVRGADGPTRTAVMA